MDFQQILRDIEYDWAILETLLPFVLIFVISFAVLQKVQVLGQNKKFNAAIAAVLGFMVVIPHALQPSDDTVVSIILNSAPVVVALIIAFILAMILSSSIGGSSTVSDEKGYMVYIALAIVLYIFAHSAWPDTIPFFDRIGDASMNLIIILLVFGLIIYFIVRGDKSPETKEEGE
ncbi:MAG: hypothetical protein ACOCZQ_00185 [Nanoarchaeota archaeon]